MVNYQSLPVRSPSTDEKTLFLGNDVVVAMQERPTVGQRIARRLVRLSVGMLALLGLLQLISFTPIGRVVPNLFNDVSRHGRHRAHHGPPHGPGHKWPPPHFHPRPIECFDLSDSKAAVNFSITLPHPGAPLHLSPSLGNADVQLYTDKADKEADIQQMPHLPIHPPHRGPPGPPHMPHGKPQTIVVGVKRTYESASLALQDATDEKKEKHTEVFVCSLELPFHQVGLGLFNEKPGKHAPPPPPPSAALERETGDDEKPKLLPKHGKFPSVAVTVRHPAGEPFTVTSAMPFFRPPPHGHPHHPPPPPHGRPHHPPPPPPHGHPHPPPPPPVDGVDQSPRHGLIIVVSTLANKACGVGRRLMTSVSRA